MSHGAQNWAWSLKIPSTDKFIVVALADMADENDSCYPGHERLADMTGQSVSTVQRSLRRLEQWGLIVRERRHTKAGYRTSDRYYLQVTAQTIATVQPPAAGEEPAAAAPEMGPGPGDKSPTGQSAYQAPRRAYRSSSASPTGHGDRAKVNPQGESPGEPSGGAPAKPTCGKHPLGTTAPCTACGDARRLWDAQRAAETAAAAAPKPPRFDPAVYCDHLQRRDRDCEACAEDARSALRNAGFLTQVGAA